MPSPTRILSSSSGWTSSLSELWVPILSLSHMVLSLLRSFENKVQSWWVCWSQTPFLTFFPFLALRDYEDSRWPSEAEADGGPF